MSTSFGEALKDAERESGKSILKKSRRLRVERYIDGSWQRAPKWRPGPYHIHRNTLDGRRQRDTNGEKVAEYDPFYYHHYMVPIAAPFRISLGTPTEYLLYYNEDRVPYEDPYLTTPLIEVYTPPRRDYIRIMHIAVYRCSTMVYVAQKRLFEGQKGGLYPSYRVFEQSQYRRLSSKLRS